MALTQDDKIQSSPRASKDPKSYEYARQMVYVLKTIWTQITFDIKDWDKEVEEAKRNKIWEKLGYASIDEVLAKEVGYSEAELKIKIKQARDNPLAGKKGGRPKKEDNLSNLQVTSPGNSNERVLRRLARDKPEMLDRIESGELSVNAAAIAAGIRKKPTPEEACVKAFAKAANRLQVFQSLVSQLDPHEVEVVSMWLKDKAASS
jgi:hypothetical protein